MNPSDETSTRLPGLRDYLRLLRRRWWVIALAALIVPLAAYVVSEQQTRLYRATSQVLVNFSDVSAAAASQSREAAFSKDDLNRFIATQAKLARAPDIAERTIKAAELGDMTTQAFLANSTVELAAGTSVLEMSVTDESRRRAIRASREYAEQYIAYRRRVDTEVLTRAADNISDRLAALRRSDRDSGPVYLGLLRQRNTLETAASLRNQNSILVAAPTGANLVQPKTARNVVIAIAVGLGLGLLLALLIDALDTRVRSADEVSDALGLPVLSAIPPPPKHLASAGKLIMVEEPQLHEAEAFRMLRANLAFADMAGDARTIMVCSALAEEGKSTTAANLAVTLARTGRSVILVDLDLRRPTVARLFGLQGRPGVTNVAVGETELDRALHAIPLAEDANVRRSANGHGDIEALLRVMPSGPLPPAPGEFAGSDRVGALLSGLTSRADVVVIDTPPLLSVGDGSAVAGHVDAILVVANLRKARRRALTSLRTRLDAAPSRKLGVVITGARGADAAYYGYYGSYGTDAYAGTGAPSQTGAGDVSTRGSES